MFRLGINEAWFGLQQGLLSADVKYSDGSDVTFQPSAFQVSNDSQVCYTLKATGEYVARGCDYKPGSFLCKRAPDGQ